jgi:amidase
MVGPELLARGRAGGPLAGVRFAAKDLFDVAGARTGAGNPDWLADAPVALENAPAVAALLAAGADLWGKTVTDELAFSLSGTNIHYGTPVNSRAPGRIPGGSSSGSASAVAGGAVDLALGTDTGGSVRVPSSYCGLFGLRPSHGRIDIRGVVPLAPSFDTVGLFAATGPYLAGAWRALVAGAGTDTGADAGTGASAHSAPRTVRRLVLAMDLLDLAGGDSRAAVLAAASQLADDLGMELTEARLAGPGGLARWRDAFRALQMIEVWRSHGDWVTARRPRFGPGVAGRFAAAAAVDPEQARASEHVRNEVRPALEEALGEDGVLVQPASSGPAPWPDLKPAARDELRGRTLMLTAPAGMAGAPVVTLPLAQVEGLPVGVALVGLPGDDDTLVALAERVAGLWPSVC